MTKSTRQYLNDLLDHLNKIQQFTGDGRETFETSEMTQFAVIRAYEVIGEIVKRLPQDFTDKTPDVNWRKLAGFRDFLAHNYDEIIVDFVWHAVEDLPELRDKIKNIVANLPDENA